MLQQGVYWGEGQRAPASFGLLFFVIKEGASTKEVGSAIHDLWTKLEEFQSQVNLGIPERNIPSPELALLIGYGKAIFALNGVKKAEPDGLAPKNQFRTLEPRVGNTILRGAGLGYEKTAARNPADCGVVVQFTAKTQTAVERGIVEAWRICTREESVLKALNINGSYMGFQPKDGRSWIGFHDGISNLRHGEQRRQTIEVKQTRPQDAWTKGGCYMVFMRMPVDLEAWETISLAEQEALVGRDKPTGCPVTGLINSDGDYSPISACPPRPPEFFEDQSYDPFREPPMAVDDMIKLSHVQRANHHSFDFENPDSLRIYRQGYEFSEGVVEGRPRVGLNFVSFVDTPARVMNLLTRKDWLGGVNFGGPDDGNSPVFTHVAASGVWFAPPIRKGDSYPGVQIFI